MWEEKQVAEKRPSKNESGTTFPRFSTALPHPSGVPQVVPRTEPNMVSEKLIDDLSACLQMSLHILHTDCLSLSLSAYMAESIMYTEFCELNECLSLRPTRPDGLIFLTESEPVIATDYCHYHQ